MDKRNFAEAAPLLLAAYNAILEAYGADNQGTANAAASLVKLYEGWGRPDQAARHRVE